MAETHELHKDLSKKTLDNHRAYQSLKEELEAIDWYAQRIDATNDRELKAILKHNMQEEMEHTAMLLEWLRRKDKALAEELKNYLFTKKNIV